MVFAGTTSQPLVIGRYSGGQTCAPRRSIASQNRLQSWPVFTRLSARASFTAAAMSAGAMRALRTSKPRASVAWAIAMSISRTSAASLARTSARLSWRLAISATSRIASAAAAGVRLVRAMVQAPFFAAARPSS